MSFFDNYKPESSSEWYACEDLQPGEVHIRSIDGLTWQQVGREKERKPCLTFTPSAACKKVGIVLSNERHEDLKSLFPNATREGDIKGGQVGIALGKSEWVKTPVLRLVEVPSKKNETPPPELVNAPNGDAEQTQEIPF